MKESEIVEGLRRAVEHGESIEHAKQTFVNAGYSPTEVERAARMLNSPINELVTEVKEKVEEFQGKKPQEPIKMKTLKSSTINYGEPHKENFFNKKSQTNQKVSEYNTKPKRDWVLIIMIAMFLILLGVLAAVYFLKG